MADDTHGDRPEVDYFSDFQDVVAQRAIAFCNLAQIADSARDPAVKDLCLAMMRKVSGTIKGRSTAEIHALRDPPPDDAGGG